MKADFNITLMIVFAQLIMGVFDPSLADFVCTIVNAQHH
jgi:hypothetical protein